MTNGQKLKKQLGLEKYPHVYISYVIGSSPDTLVVLYDSVRKNMPISSQYMKRYSNITFLKRGTELRLSTPFDIERSNHNINTGMLMIYDIAMSAMTTRESATTEDYIGELDSVYDLKEGNLSQRLFKGYVGRLSELTLKDLKDGGRSGISDRTFAWFSDRNKNGFTGAKAFKLVDCSLSEGDNSFTFYFLTEATEGTIKTKSLLDSPYNYDDPKGEVNPENGFSIGSNGSKTYEVQLKFLDLKEFLEYLNTKPDSSDVTKADIEYLISNQDVQYFSNSPSFNYQGYANVATQLGLSIFPQNITSKQWMPKTFGGEYYLDKHLYSLVRAYKFFSQQMAQMLKRKLKDRGLI